MLHKVTTEKAGARQPRLSRIWIRTGHLRAPLKAVWIDESSLLKLLNEPSKATGDNETAELAEDHLRLAAIGLPSLSGQ